MKAGGLCFGEGDANVSVEREGGMDWTAVGAAALGGAAGGLLGSLLGRVFPEKWRRLATTALVVCLAIAGSRLASGFMDRRQSEPDNIAQALLSDPRLGSVAEAWRETDPASFREAISTLSESVRARRDRNEAVAEMRFLLTSAAVPRMKHLDDAQIMELLHVAREEFAELAVSSPGTCNPMFNGRAFGDITPYVSPSLIEREGAIMEAAFRADASAPREITSGEAQQAEIDTLLAGLRERVGEDAAMLEAASVDGVEARYCEVVVAFYDEWLELPPERAAALMRGLR